VVVADIEREEGRRTHADVVGRARWGAGKANPRVATLPAGAGVAAGGARCGSAWNPHKLLPGGTLAFDLQQIEGRQGKGEATNRCPGGPAVAPQRAGNPVVTCRPAIATKVRGDGHGEFHTTPARVPMRRHNVDRHDNSAVYLSGSPERVSRTVARLARPIAFS